jgi:hypothetical protein
MKIVRVLEGQELFSGEVLWLDFQWLEEMFR